MIAPAAPGVAAGTAAADTRAADTSAAGTAAPGDIARRPAIDPELLAVLSAAVEEAWPRPRVVVAEEPDTLPAWRFSGRWWSRPASARRDRPWA